MLKLELTIEEVNNILSHLDKGVYGQVAGLIAKIREQAVPQLEKKEEPKATKKEK